MDNLIHSLRDTIFTEETVELMADVSEIGIDSIFENELLMEVPILKTIIAIYHVGDRIKERRLIKHTIAFVNSFNKGKITKDAIEKYQKKLESNDYLVDELERILFLLERNTEEAQSKILAQMYLSYVKGRISWDKFCELSEANRRMFIADIRIMRIFERKDKYYHFSNNEKHQLVRLVGLGMLAEKESPAARDYRECGEVERKYLKKERVKNGVYYTIDDEDELKYEITNFGDLYLSYIEG